MKIANLIILLVAGLSFFSCKKNQPSYKIEGDYRGNIQGTYQGNDTIVNTNFLVQIKALDKSTCTVAGNLFSTFTVLVTPNGLNVELVSPTEGLNQFLYEGETKKLTFQYTKNDDIVTYVGTQQ